MCSRLQSAFSFAYAFCLLPCTLVGPDRKRSQLMSTKRRGMTSLRLFETDGAAVYADAPSHLFDTPSQSKRYRARSWPYATSVVLHAMMMISLVILGRYLVQTPRPAPERPVRTVAHTFVFSGLRGDNSNQPRVVHSTRHSRMLSSLSRAMSAPALLPRGDSLAPDTSSLVDEKPPQPAFDPPILRPQPDGRPTRRSERGRFWQCDGQRARIAHRRNQTRRTWRRERPQRQHRCVAVRGSPGTR